MRRARLLVVLCFALAAALPVAPARADGDPASDILLAQDAYYPYAPLSVAKELQVALDGMLKAAKAKRFEVKVALIAAPVDLGAVPQLFTDPQRYADLLTSEISFNTKPRVLVVLPAGLGGNNLGDNAATALDGIAPEEAAGSDGLARAAMLAVGRLAAANGTPIPIPAVARDKGRATGDRDKGGGTSPLIVFGVPVLLVALIAGGAAIAGRRAENEDGETEVGETTGGETEVGETAGGETEVSETAGSEIDGDSGDPDVAGGSDSDDAPSSGSGEAVVTRLPATTADPAPESPVEPPSDPPAAQ
ncbi:hypothetical protein DSM112329_04009 [Paraconexibacter sp. AEG42_29]|uniref:TPM domain-containing protein n=1 Tax=Paraconexibacter sp. AEG42_29 TaxID=2997339 RepID=A0AAU7AZR5_9ACTN